MKRRSFLKFLGVATITPSILNSFETNNTAPWVEPEVIDNSVSLNLRNEEPTTITEGSIWLSDKGIHVYKDKNWQLFSMENL